MTYIDLIGKPFRYGARGPEFYDCYGLCMEVYRRRGAELPDFGSSPSSSLIHRMILDNRRLFLELAAPEPWCLVTFMVRPPYTSHIGVVLEDGARFLHILRSTRVCIERLDSQLWGRRITSYLRWPCPSA